MGPALDTLGFKLVWKDQIRMMNDPLEGGDDVVVDVEPALVAHDRVQY